MPTPFVFGRCVCGRRCTLMNAEILFLSAAIRVSLRPLFLAPQVHRYGFAFDVYVLYIAIGQRAGL